ncbi:MAG: acyl-CoA thioesterase [Rikenellaceae bacterium]|nr:acyl-CoA thioesterase [Rikenellaceae bacterium]
MKVTETEIQKRFADVDMLGHVNNVNLQHYYDLGKSDYFCRVLGLGSGVWHERGIITASTRTDYLAQTRYSERVVVHTRVERVGTKSLTMKQRIVGYAPGADQPEIKSESTSVMVAFDFDRQVSIPVPDEWRRAMTGE